MANTFRLLDLVFVVLTASSAAFMVWVFWNLSVQIRRELRTRVVPPESEWTPEPANEPENSKERVYSGAEARLWNPDPFSALTRRAKVERFERRFASRSSH